MPTNNMLNLPLSGTSGTVSFVGSTSPTLVTPTLGVASATSINFLASTAGTIGTTTNDNAAALSVGQFVSSSVLVAGAINVPNGVYTTITSIALTPGDWDLAGTIIFNSGAASTASSTLVAISDTAGATQVPFGENTFSQTLSTMGASQTQIMSANGSRYSLGANTTIYLLANAFITGTMTAYGFISARRVR